MGRTFLQNGVQVKKAINPEFKTICRISVFGSWSLRSFPNLTGEPFFYTGWRYDAPHSPEKKGVETLQRFRFAFFCQKLPAAGTSLLPLKRISTIFHFTSSPLPPLIHSRPGDTVRMQISKTYPSAHPVFSFFISRKL